MIGEATLGANDIGKAHAFATIVRLDRRQAHHGIRRAHDFTMYGVAFDKPAIAITRPYDGKAASVGNDMMVAIPLDRRDQVDAFHAKALSLGGSDEGAPGLRGDEGPQAFYGAYFRDLDGNKLCAFRIGPGRFVGFIAPSRLRPGCGHSAG